MKEIVGGKTKALKGTDRVTITTDYNYQSRSNLPFPSRGTDVPYIRDIHTLLQ